MTEAIWRDFEGGGKRGGIIPVAGFLRASDGNIQGADELPLVIKNYHGFGPCDASE
ncbi:MAG: hypothetical protein JHD35_05115 [Sphingopyxis sp.]|nr:hypothetical protein [Sphingopyxis sp.]